MTSPIKFLLVDDLEANLVALEALLLRDGLVMLKASSGDEALELLLAHDVALAFLDVQMPGMGGFELAEIMRTTGRTRGVPIVFLTAGVVDQERRQRGYKLGAVDFLPKPIDPDNLLNKATIFFELARQRNQLRENESRLRTANERLAQGNAELERADRSKDEFLAMLAHELRNPLAPMRNATEVLQNPASGAAMREQALSMLARQIRNMDHMIDDLLDVSRITQGKIELRRETVNLEEILISAAEACRPACQNARQSLALALPESPVFLHGDATRLEQILGNLLSNASKYSGSGSNIVLAAARSGTASAPEVTIRVSDDGTGIDPETLPRVFELFVQASRTIDRAHGGLGIGLTIVSRLVKMHGGTIEARSEGLGKGTEFIIRLPALPPAASQLAAPAVSNERDAGKPPLRLLIVDDNRDAAESMAMLQEMDGHVTRVAHNGHDALVAAEEFAPDVVILDIGLPGMDGYEVAARLRTTPRNKDLFLIALTGYASNDGRAGSSGFDRHLVKPADLAVLRGWLNERSLANV